MKVRELPTGTDTSLGDELVASLKEGMAILRGDAQPARFYPAPAAVNVRAIRKMLGITQQAFARRFGFTVAAVRDWEQGRCQPEAAARVLLLVIAHNPSAVDDAIRAAETMAA